MVTVVVETFSTHASDCELQQTVFYPSPGPAVRLARRRWSICVFHRCLNIQTATQMLLPGPDALWVPGGQFSSRGSVWADTHTNTHVHLTWCTVLSYNPICRVRVLLMTWQPGGFLYLLSGNPGSHLLSGLAEETLDHDSLCQENHPLEVDYSDGQTLESLPWRREANCRQRASLPIMPCLGVE